MSHSPSIQTVTPLALSKSVYWESVVTKVEDELFRMPIYGLVESRQVFFDMLSLPQAEGSGRSDAEGTSDERPTLQEGYKAREFKTFLEVIYPTAENVMTGGFVK